jgi:hypothetical protein
VARYGLPRPDVREAYGDVVPLETAGFRLLVPAHTIGPGPHQVFVCATVAPVPQPTCGDRAFDVSEAKPLWQSRARQLDTQRSPRSHLPLMR